MTGPRTFWCNGCESWTILDETDMTGMYCSSCGDDYGCGECGFEIDSQGNCQRPADMGRCPESKVPA